MHLVMNNYADERKLLCILINENQDLHFKNLLDDTWNYVLIQMQSLCFLGFAWLVFKLFGLGRIFLQDWHLGDR